MPLPEVTYSDYQAWGGKREAGAFSTSLPHAKAAVRRVLGFNVPDTDAQAEAYRNAGCAAVPGNMIEQVDDQGIGRSKDNCLQEHLQPLST